MSIQPFSVQWRLRAPLRTPDNPIHLDALLAYAVVQEAIESGHPIPTDCQHDLPIERHFVGDKWCFKASALTLAPSFCTQNIPMTRIARVSDYAEAVEAGDVITRMDTLSLGSGRYKAYLFSHQIQQSDCAMAFGIGNIERVIELLTRVKSIGKLRRFNAGAIQSFEVREDSGALELWKNRVIPANDLTPIPGRAHLIAGFRPPYWDRADHQMCSVNAGGLL